MIGTKNMCEDATSAIFSETISETKYISSHASFGQGDILKLLDRPRAPHLGVVINADCDLMHNKIDDVYSYLPIYTLSEYLSLFWLDKFLEKQENQLLEDILTTIKMPMSERNNIQSWLHSTDATVLAKNLSSELDLDGKSQTKLKKYTASYRSIFYSERNILKRFQALCNLQSNAKTYAQRQLKTAFRQIVDSHLFLNEIHGQPGLGYVIRMKRIYSIEQEKYFRSKQEFLTSNNSNSECAFRVAKMTPILQYKLLQLFANQFSRIGLPDEFRDMNNLVIDELAASLVEKKI